MDREERIKELVSDLISDSVDVYLGKYERESIEKDYVDMFSQVLTCGWIPVADRLPEYSKEYPLLDKFNRRRRGERWKTLRHGVATDVWMVDGDICNLHDMDYITLWFDVPDPVEGEGGK